jgi:undecaprenyl-diphosphatase
MNYIYSLILGIIQGLILARVVMKFEAVDGLTFDVALHMGTLLALVVYFYRDIGWLLRGFRNSLIGPTRLGSGRSRIDERLPWYIIAGNVPAALAGYFFEAQIEHYFRHPSVIVITLSAVAVLFLVFERISKQRIDLPALTFRPCFMIGLAQTLALIPGTSRSGITILTGIALGVKREAAARFSFLLSIPVVAGAGLKKAIDLHHTGISGDEVGVMAVGLLASALVGWLAIRFLLRYLQNHRLDGFAYYRLALAAVVLVVMLIHGL